MKTILIAITSDYYYRSLQLAYVSEMLCCLSFRLNLVPFVHKRTLANLSKLPDDTVDSLRILLKGGTAIENLLDAFEIVRSRPHGHQL
jgi:hypothetical protein